MGSRWVHGELHLPSYRERSWHRSARLPRRLCRTISKSCSWPLRVLSFGSCATVKNIPCSLLVPPRHEEFELRGTEESTRARRTSARGQARPSDDVGRMTAPALLSGHARITS